MKAYKYIFSSLVFCGGILISSQASADGRHFTYVYEAKTEQEGELEFEQYITNESGRSGGDYSRWTLRSEIEYGITDRLTTALYLNLRDTKKSGFEGVADSSEFDFTGFSSEWIYQLINPAEAPIGLAIYGEATTDGMDHELEAKIIASSDIGNWRLAANAVYEAEFEQEDGQTEKEAEAQLVAGVAYKFDRSWSAGIELRNKQAFPGGLNLSGQEYNTISVGPNVRYAGDGWWFTFTILPQVWGNGDGSSGGLNRAHEDGLEVRAIIGTRLD